MGLAKNGYYTTQDIDKLGAQYNIILGERSPGKSYGVKEKLIREAWNSGTASFGVIRRFQEDIKTDYIQHYFEDNNIPSDASGSVYNITSGQYTQLHVWQSKIYFSNVNKKGQIEHGPLAGYVFALAMSERYKSQQYPSIKSLVFEEFVTNKMYLSKEPVQLLNFVSTVARDRDITVYMVANTISRVCPYFQDWGLVHIPEQDPGTIDTYTLDSTLIAVEFVKSRGRKNKMFFGQAAKSITGGQWETESMPHLIGSYDDYDCIYDMYVRVAGFTFKMELLINDGGETTVYIYPYTKRIKQDIPIITDTYDISRLHIKRLRSSVLAERQIAQLFTEGKVCYASNLCGADFTACAAAAGFMRLS